MCYFWGSSSMLPPPCQHHQVELNESEPTHGVLCWLEELLGTENQHCLCSKVYFLHWGSIDLKPSRSVIIWPNCFQQRSHEICFGCTQYKEADSQLHLSPKKGVYSSLSQRACVGELFVNDNIKKIHNSQCGTQILNTLRVLCLISVYKFLWSHMAQALLWASIFIIFSVHACELFPCLCKDVLYDMFTLALLIFSLYSVETPFIHAKQK